MSKNDRSRFQSKLSTGSLPRKRSKRALVPKALALAVASCFAANLAIANPTGPSKVSGGVSVSQTGKLLTITNSPGAIINWKSFSIGPDEITRFLQQSASSAVLNRVAKGASASEILGQLQSRLLSNDKITAGRVFLINPNGIVIGAGAVIDVGGLVASTLNLSDGDFLAGRMRFTDTPGAGSLVNHGAITTPTGGQVYLIAPNVQNTGIITSPQGEVILAAGSSVELVDSSTPELRVELTASDNEAVNVGQIIANSGKIGIYAGLIRNSGVIRADGVSINEHGEILLKATQNTTTDAGSLITANGTDGGNITLQSGGTTLIFGTVEAKGSEGKGGTVHLLGHLVGVVDNAIVDASGHAGGGTVLVGGDYQGRNPDVQNAYRTYVGPNASIRADAIANGDGGKVIVWSDDATRVYGSISARGGAQSGSGGLVETSGHSLEVTRGPDVSAPSGTPGMWLIDPVDLNVVLGFAAVNNTAAPFFSPLADSSTIGVDLINAQLDLGSNVVLLTTSQGATAGTQAGNITISAPILKKAATTENGPVIGTTSLTMEAHNNIVIDATGSITSTGDPLNVILNADADGVGGGGVTINGAITTRGGNVSIQGRDRVAVNAPINTVLSSGGSVSLSSLANAVQVSSAVKSGSSFFASGFTGVSIDASITSGSSVVLSSTTGPVTVAAPVVSEGFFSATAGGGNTLTLGAPVTSTGAQLIADDMAIQRELKAGSGSISALQNSNGRAVDLGTNTAGKLSLTQTESNNLITSGSLNIGNFNTGAITVSAPLNRTLSNAVNLQGASIIQNASVNVSSPLTVTTDNATIGSELKSTASVTIQPRSSGRPVNLGAALNSGTAIDLSAAELNNIVTPVLRIGNSSTGPVTIVDDIAPASAGILVLTSGFGNNITQTLGATLSHANVVLNSFGGSVNMPEANNVSTLAGSASAFNGLFRFANAPGIPLTIGNLDGTNGVRFNGSNGTINLIADNLTVTSPISAPFSNGAVVIQPALAAAKLDLGGADGAEVLGILNSELANISATTLTFKADQADISAPVTFATGTLAIAPLTANRPLHIMVGAKDPTRLEFTRAELGNVTANSFVLGDANTGPVTVEDATTIPASIGTFTLRSGNIAGITLSTDDGFSLSATGNLAFFGDTMNVNANVTSDTGNITIAPNTPGRPIDLGSKPAGSLGLDADELDLLSAPGGTLIFGNSASGALTVSEDVTLANRTLLIANVMNIDALLTTTAGDITVRPGAPRAIELGSGDIVGSTLGLVVGEINNFRPAGGTGVLRIGDFTNTNSITVTADIAPANATTLSLLARNTISQTPGSIITENNLRASSDDGSVNLTQSNNVGTLAGSSSGSFSFTNSQPLTIGTVDGTTGIDGSLVTLTSDEIAINQNIFANNVILKPVSSEISINIGTNVAEEHSFDQVELNRIFATSVTIGDTSSDDLTVNAPITILSSRFSDLILITGGTAAVSSALSVPRNLTVNADTITNTAAITSSSGNITMEADAMTFGAGVSAPSGTISLRPNSDLITMNLGGADVLSTTLGLNATDLGNLSAEAFAFGGGSTPSITVSAATNLGATPTSLITTGGGTGIINVNAPLTSGNLALTTDNLVPTDTVTAPNVTLNTVTAGRIVDLGTHIVGAALGLDQADINRITTTGTFTVNAGDINVSEPVSFPNATNLTLRGDTMTIGDTVTSPGGGIITVAPRTFNRPMNLGSKVAGALGLLSAEINRFLTSGVLRLGDSSTGTMTVSAPIAPAGASAVSLISRNEINQNEGATITETNLRVTSIFNSVNLTENNNVVTLAGTSSGSFSFTDTGALTIGTVDGVDGISDNTVSIKADNLTINQQIFGGNVTLAPRVAGESINLGSNPAGVFGVTDAEMDLISAFSLTFGDTTTGPVTVSSAMSRSAGVLNIVTGEAQAVNINAALSAPSGVSVTGGSTNVRAPVSSSFGNVTINSDSMDIAAPITSPGTVTLRPLTDGRPIELGTENPAALSLTAAEINQINASSLTSSLTIGSTVSGPLNVSAPIAPAGGTESTRLSLVSGGNITQDPGATIVTKKEIVADGVTTVTGSLNVVSSTGNVVLPEANDAGSSLSGSVSGEGTTFDFVNIGALKLQNVDISPDPSSFVAIATNPVRVSTGIFTFVGFPNELFNALNFIVGEINSSADSLIENEQEDQQQEANMCSS